MDNNNFLPFDLPAKAVSDLWAMASKSYAVSLANDER
jgi:hypothetical protein